MNAKHVKQRTPGVNFYGSWRQGVLFVLTVVGVVVFDQLTKQLLRDRVAPLEVVPVFGCLSFCHICNPGSAFGIFARQSVLITLAAVAGLAAILLFSRYFRQSSKLGSLALALVFGGAIGNLIDRFRFGCVTDFIDVRLWRDFHWPAFNVADSAITVGVIALLVFIFQGLRKSDGGTPEVTD